MAVAKPITALRPLEALPRRSVLLGLPALGVALAVSDARTGQALVGDIIETPFLHVLDGPIPGDHYTHHTLQAGDMVLVLPGTGPFDDTYLLRDGRFAAVTFNPADRQDVRINIYGSDDRFSVTRDRADDLIAGRVVKRIRLDRGLWKD